MESGGSQITMSAFEAELHNEANREEVASPEPEALLLRRDEPPGAAPPCLDEFLGNLEEHVRQFVKSRPKFATTALKREAIHQTLLWEETRCVHSMRCCAGGEGGSLEWQARLWVSRHELEEVVLSTRYVKDHLLTECAFQKQCFQSDCFVAPRKYDLRQTLDDTKFHSIRRLTSNNFEVADLHGFWVPVGKKWIRNHYKQQGLQLANGEQQIIDQAACPAHQPTDSAICSVVLPEIKYRNHDNRCLPASCASALHYLGHELEARLISRVQGNGQNVFVNTKALVNKLFTKANGKPVPYRKARYQPLNCSDRRPNPIIASLKAEKMQRGIATPVHISHAVCFVENYIFDSNMETALPNDLPSLNLICDAVEPGSTYCGINWSREIVLFR
jgi:hypothetical protein